MTTRTVAALTGVAAIACGVTAVVYLNFSLRVMPRFADSPDARGLARMQAFNRTAVQAPFMLAFFGAAAIAVVLTVRVARGHRTTYDLLGALGGIAYLAGFLLTIAYNVPLNDKLARLDANAPASLSFWRHYLHAWTTGNSVRAVFSMVATAAMLTASVGLIRQAPSASHAEASTAVPR